MNIIAAVIIIGALLIMALSHLFKYLKNAFSARFERNNELQRKVGELQSQLLQAQEATAAVILRLTEKTADFQKLQHQKISADVKLGQRYENILPFMEKFPYKDDEIRGLFNPIDLVVFRADEVVFVEVKTGTAQLSEKQRQIRDNIKAGRVRFEVHRMDENGVRIK